jgi:hypothetical protein
MDATLASLAGAGTVPPASPVPPGTPVPGGIQVPLPGPVAVLIGMAALAIVAIPFLWPLIAHFNTMAHEGAHAVTGALLGFAPLGMHFERDASAATFFPGSMRGPREVVIGAMGYLGPSAFGLAAAKLIETGHVVAVPRIAVVLLVLMLFLIRKSFGLVSVPVAIAVLALVMRDGHGGVEEFTVYAMTWLLLLSGVRVAVAHGAWAGDAVILSAITRLPRRFWALLWLAGSLLAVVIGGKWMVLRS